MDYILGIREESGCVFCRDVLASGVDPDLVLHRGTESFVIMNLYPYSIGHLMIVPYRHVGRLPALSAAEISEMTGLLQKAERIVAGELGTSRHQVGINVGRCAGAGVEGHLHIHLVPEPSGRCDPDTTELAEPLVETRDRLRRAWESDGSKSGSTETAR